MAKFFSNKYVQLVLRIIVGGVFIYAAWFKLLKPYEFAHAIMSYQLLPEVFVNLAAVTLPYIELFAGVLLIFGLFEKGNAVIIGALLVVFLIGLIWGYAHGLKDCGCFGPVNSIDSEGSSADILIRIVEDILLLIATVLIYVYGKGSNSKELNKNLNQTT